MPGWHEGYMVVLDADDIFNFEIISYIQCSDKIGIELLESRNKEHFLFELKNYSDVLQTPARLEEKWNEFIQVSSQGYLSHLSMLNRYSRALLRRLGLLEFFLNRRKLRLVHNLIRAEAHREICLDVLDKYMET